VQTKYDLLMFQLPNLMCRKMSKLKLLSAMLSDMISCNAWHDLTRRIAPRHQQNVDRPGSHMQTSQTPRVHSPVLPSTSRCFQPPLELCKVLSDSASAFSGASESTCSYGGVFRMLRDLTIRIVKCWSC